MDIEVDFSNLNINAEARLPREIEFEIFNLAYHNCDDVAGEVNLFQVAHRVSEWFIPLFYEAVFISITRVKSRCPPLSALEKYGHHIRHLWVSIEDGGRLPFPMSSLLSSCPNVENLACWNNSFLTGEVLDLPITRLTVHHFGFIKDRFEANLEEPKLLAWRSNITHLSIGYASTETNCAYLAHFPALEYLLLLDHNGYTGADLFLKHCPQLKVVIRLVRCQSTIAKSQILATIYVDDENLDVRSVKVIGNLEKEWVLSTKGIDGMWEMAEAEVKKRQGARKGRWV